MPLWLNRQFGTLIGLAMAVSGSQASKVTAENIRRSFPKLSDAEQDHLIRSSLVETGKMSLEVAPVWLRPWSWVSSKITTVQGEALLKACVEDDRGVIVVAPHLGNWEVLGPYLSSFTHMTALYQPPKVPAFDEIIRESRERMGATLVPTDRKGVMGVLKALKKGGLTVILPDQVPDSGAEHVPFFDIPASTMTLVSNLIERTGSRVVMGFVLRVQGGFELRFQEPDPDIYSSELMVSLQAMNRSVEACVLQAPSQYQWEYKRFRRPPAGLEKPYQF
jgi:KDO2-lipid IV(A) lauroyltransferase